MILSTVKDCNLGNMSTVRGMRSMDKEGFSSVIVQVIGSSTTAVKCSRRGIEPRVYARLGETGDGKRADGERACG